MPRMCRPDKLRTAAKGMSLWLRPPRRVAASARGGEGAVGSHGPAGGGDAAASGRESADDQGGGSGGEQEDDEDAGGNGQAGTWQPPGGGVAGHSSRAAGPDQNVLHVHARPGGAAGMPSVGLEPRPIMQPLRMARAHEQHELLGGHHPQVWLVWRPSRSAGHPWHWGPGGNFVD